MFSSLNVFTGGPTVLYDLDYTSNNTQDFFRRVTAFYLRDKRQRVRVSVTNYTFSDIGVETTRQIVYISYAGFQIRLSPFFIPHNTAPTLHTTHSTLHISYSTLLSPHIPPHTSHSTLPTPNSTLHTQHTTMNTLHFTLHTHHTPHSILYTLHPTHHTPHITTPHPTPNATSCGAGAVYILW